MEKQLGKHHHPAHFHRRTTTFALMSLMPTTSDINDYPRDSVPSTLQPLIPISAPPNTPPSTQDPSDTPPDVSPPLHDFPEQETQEEEDTQETQEGGGEEEREEESVLLEIMGPEYRATQAYTTRAQARKQQEELEWAIEESLRENYASQVQGEEGGGTEGEVGEGSQAEEAEEGVDREQEEEGQEEWFLTESREDPVNCLGGTYICACSCNCRCRRTCGCTCMRVCQPGCQVDGERCVCIGGACVCGKCTCTHTCDPSTSCRLRYHYSDRHDPSTLLRDTARSQLRLLGSQRNQLREK